MPKHSLDGHHHDGIEELDNPLPRWWVYLFYATIIFSIGYAPYYWFGYGKSAVEVLAQDQRQSTPQNSKDNKRDASLAAAVKDPAKITAGLAVFTAKCTPCHGPNGGGIIGPNLTDAYWIHGKGTPEDILKVVTEGVPAKGMLAWGTVLTPEELVAVVAYVHSLVGTTPTNPKAPEGTQIQ
jgi:cytochrome c oxidase cbb3-type subunit 3